MSHGKHRETTLQERTKQGHFPFCGRPPRKPPAAHHEENAHAIGLVWLKHIHRQSHAILVTIDDICFDPNIGSSRNSENGDARAHDEQKCSAASHRGRQMPCSCHLYRLLTDGEGKPRCPMEQGMSRRLSLHASTVCLHRGLSASSPQEWRGSPAEFQDVPEALVGADPAASALWIIDRSRPSTHIGFHHVDPHGAIARTSPAG